MSITSQESELLIRQMDLIYSRFRAWCHAFQPIKNQYLCFVVFCLLFLVIVDVQHQVSHSIIAESNDTNNKQSYKSQDYLLHFEFAKLYFMKSIHTWSYSVPIYINITYISLLPTQLSWTVWLREVCIMHLLMATDW